MSKKNNDQTDAQGVDTWRDGHSAGTNETFDWCAERAKEFSSLAKTEDGRRAMGFIMRAIEAEKRRRYPPEVENA